MTLEQAISKIERWRDNIDANATHFERRGYEADVRKCRARSDDLSAVLELLKDVECYPLTHR